MIETRLKSSGEANKDRAHRQPVVYLFSGQGSQYYNMARTLYRQNDSFRQTLNHLDRHVQRKTGESILSVLYDSQRDKGEPFTQLLLTHPAIFCVQYALANHLQQAGLQPDYVMGISLGEFVAAAIAGVVEPKMALDAVLTQAITIKQRCSPGGMLAIMSSVELFSQHPEIFDGCEMAGINYDEHFVISGPHRVLERIKMTLQDFGVLCMSLPVDYAFHSTLIEPAAQSYLHYLSMLPLKEPMIPMVSCHTGEMITSLGRDHFWQVTRKPMRFSTTLKWFERNISEGRGVIYIDLGPGGTLANFIKRGLEAQSTSTFQSVITPFDQEIARLQDVAQCLINNTIRG